MSKGSQFEIPVLFLTFNRLNTAKKVFAEIKKSNVSKLYISSDGPRENKPEENEIIEEIRSYILGNIDWECEIFTRFNNTNLGCKTAVSNAINWFFDNEEMGIVLEDDCLPSQSFFPYCEQLLRHYKDDERVFLISGYNKQQKWKHDQQDYFFSNLGGIWGWASWRRAWKFYDVDANDLDEFIYQDGFTNSLGIELGKLKQDMIYTGLRQNLLDSWALQWGYARHKNNGLTCIPSISQIQNIGFGEDATHTIGEDEAYVLHFEIEMPMKENTFVVPDLEYDSMVFERPSYVKRLFKKISKFFSNLN